MKTTIFTLILLFFGAIYCYSQENESEISKPIEVSLNELIKYPKKYNKKNILVKGYAKFDREISRIFVSKEDFEENNINNSVYFTFFIERSTYSTVEKCDKKYIKLSGIYTYGKKINSRNKSKIENGVISSVVMVSCE